MKTPKENGKCIHYANVDEGFYCWKCIQIIEKEQTKKFKEELKKYETCEVCQDKDAMVPIMNHKLEEQAKDFSKALDDLQEFLIADFGQKDWSPEFFKRHFEIMRMNCGLRKPDKQFLDLKEKFLKQEKPSNVTNESKKV